MKTGYCVLVVMTLAVLVSTSFGATYGGGSGTSADPYQIWTPEQMNTIGINVDDWDKCFKLMANLDMSAYSGTQYNIIGRSLSFSFSGSFDGNRHVIGNLIYATASTVSDVGLFGVVKDGTISNLGLDNVSISTGGDRAGGIVGFLYYGAVTSCYVTGSVNCSRSAGGIAGRIEYGTIDYSYATASVHCSNRDAGGAAGQSYYGHINTCYAAGPVSGPFFAGGLVGYNSGFFVNSFWDTQASDQDFPVGYGLLMGTTGKTTAEMKSYWTFADAGWDFASDDGDAADWQMYTHSYPQMTWQGGSMTLRTCSVAAGKARDSIRFSGIVNVTVGYFETAAAAGGSVTVSIDAELLTDPVTQVFPMSTAMVKNGKYAFKNANSMLNIDTITGQTSFSARNISLAGLACPMTITISVGNYSASIEINEAIVNGSKPCPVQLLRGVKSTLTVDKYKVNQGRKAGTDSFTIQGTFTIGGDYDKANPLKITLGTQAYEVSGGLFTEKNGILSCKKASLSDALVAAKFDFAKCTYTITVKNTEITDIGKVAFGMNCFGDSLEGLAFITIK